MSRFCVIQVVRHFLAWLELDILSGVDNQGKQVSRLLEVREGAG